MTTTPPDDEAGLGWPHEWDPIALGDTCLLADEQHGIVVHEASTPPPKAHKVTAPYVRWGSGYACRSCADAERTTP